MEYRYAVHRRRNGLWRVIDLETGASILDHVAESIARDHCADRNHMLGRRPAAPTLRCIACLDKGYFADPDGGPPEPCSCRWPAGTAQQHYDERLDYVRELRRLATYRH